MGKNIILLQEVPVMSEKDELLENCFLTWVSVLEEEDSKHNKIRRSKK